MAVAERGYRHWEGRLRGRGTRWLTVARWGIAHTGRSKWLRRLVLVAWLPLLYFVLAFFVVGQLTEVRTLDAAKDMWQFQLMRFQFGTRLSEAFIADPASFRPMIWSTLFYFQLYVSLVWVMLSVAVVGPELISTDLASRSLALYFSKPLTRLDYLAGKLAVVGFWIGAVSLAPALLLYGLSILFSPNLETLSQTAGIVPRLVAVGLVLALGAGAPMLALSSLTHNPRFLGFVWAGLWVMSHVASRVLSYTLFPLWDRAARAEADWTGLVSLFKNFHAVTFGLLEVEARLAPAAELSPRAARWLDRFGYDHDWRLSLLIVMGLALCSLVLVTARVGRPGEAGSQ